MIVELLVNLKGSDGRIIRKGRYDDRRVAFDPKIYREVELGRRKTVRVVKKDPPPKNEAPAPKAESQEETVTTMDEGQDAVTVQDEDSEVTVQEETPEENEEKAVKKKKSRRRGYRTT